MTEHILKSFALLIGGALMGALASLLVMLVGSKGCLLSILFSVGIACIAFGLGLFSIISQRINRYIRKRYPKIGILSDIPKNDDQNWPRAYDPNTWKEAIKKQITNNEITVKLIKVKDKFDSFTAVINPYPGVYPEIDLKNLKTLDKIMDYVKNSGLFVNVADIPGYFAYNAQIKRKLDITPPAFWALNKGNLVPIRPFDRTPLLEKAGLRAKKLNDNWDIEFEGDFQDVLGSDVIRARVIRAIVVEKNVKPVIKPKKIDGEEMTPISFVGYGDGEILLSSILINEQVDDAREKLITTLTKLIIHDIKKKSSGKFNFRKIISLISEILPVLFLISVFCLVYYFDIPLNLDTLNIVTGFLLTILIFLTGSYYTIWKAYENNALNSFLKLELFCDFESDKTYKSEKKAKRLLHSANYWRWLYNTDCIKVRRFFSSVIFVSVYFFSSLILSLLSTKLGKFDCWSLIVYLIWFAYLMSFVILVQYLYGAFKIAKKIADKGEKGDVSCDYLLCKNNWFNNLIFEKFKIIDPFLDKRFEDLRKRIRKKFKHKMWFYKNINRKGDF